MQPAHIPLQAMSKHESAPSLPSETHSREGGKNLGQVLMGSVIRGANLGAIPLASVKAVAVSLFLAFFFFKSNLDVLKISFIKIDEPA